MTTFFKRLFKSRQIKPLSTGYQIYLINLIELNAECEASSED